MNDPLAGRMWRGAAIAAPTRPRAVAAPLAGSSSSARTIVAQFRCQRREGRQISDRAKAASVTFGPRSPPLPPAGPQAFGLRWSTGRPVRLRNAVGTVARRVAGGVTAHYFSLSVGGASTAAAFAEVIWSRTPRKASSAASMKSVCSVNSVSSSLRAIKV